MDKDPSQFKSHAKSLSTREAEVLRWMSEGKTNREIGLILGIACGTVRKHAENIYRKLDVENRMLAALHLRRVEEEGEL